MTILKSAYDAACGKLAARLRTEKEIKDFLSESGYGSDEIREAIEELKSFGYINDARYCEEYFRYGKQKSKSDSRIIREIAQKGIPAEVSRNIIEDLRTQSDGEYEEDRQTAMNTALKMAKARLEEGKAPDDKFFAKVGRRLFQLGYDSGTIYGVIADLKTEIRHMYSEEEYDSEE